MKKYLLLLIACISISGYAQAQNLPEELDPGILPQVFSPDAKELGKYGKVPVNYFNGLPSITIPLTELRAKNYTLPVYLSYHASGNRPDNHPGWVGQGWSLHAGGCINRIIRGQKDEMTQAEFEEDINRYEIYMRLYYDPGYRSGKHIVVENPGYLYHAEKFQGEIQSKGTGIPQARFVDNEPDEFQINVDGINASFYLAGNGKVKIVSKSDDDFTVTYSMNTDAPRFSDIRTLKYKIGGEPIKVYNTFSEFIVTSKDGTKYHFGGYEDAIEYSFRSCNLDLEHTADPQSWELKATANTWMLTKIERPDGEEITFLYRRGGTPIVEEDSHRFEYAWLSKERQYPVYDSHIDDKNISFYFLLPSYLWTVNSNSGGCNLTFHTSPSIQLDYDYTPELFEKRVGKTGLYEFLNEKNYYEQLESIELRLNDIDCDLEKIHFSYTKNPETRLKLDTVKVSARDCDPLKYIMTYDTTPLPRYHSRQTDMWGYYNYKNKYVPSSDHPLGDRFLYMEYDANLALLQAEMLTRIDYPTGGWTSFEYEPHDYSQVAQQFPFKLSAQSRQAGGLRIRKITDIAPGQQPNERTFSYTKKAGVSSGILSGIPRYYVQIDAKLENDYNYLEAIHFIISSERALNQLSETEGNHVTYSKVTESVSGAGRTEYYYTNHDTQEMPCMDRSPIDHDDNMCNETLYNPFSSMSLSRGLLQKKSTFNSSNAPVMEEQYNYAQDTTDCIYSQSLFVYDFYPEVFRSSLTKIYTFYPKLTRKVVKSYPDGSGNPSVEKTEYSYNSHRQLSSITRSDGSKNETVRMTYIGDMDNTYPYGEMKAAGIFDRPVERTVLRGIPVISSSLITYRMSINESDTLFVPDEYYESRISSPIPSHHSNEWSPYKGEFSKIQQSIYGAPRITFDSYDAYGNILSATDEGGRCSRYHWDNKGLNPEASFTGMLKYAPAVQIKDTATEGVDFHNKEYEEYTYEFDADYTGDFSFVMEWPDCIDYGMRGYLDGKSIFVHRIKPTPVGGETPRKAPRVNPDSKPLPTTELYHGTITAGHHKFKIVCMGETNSFDQIFLHLDGAGTITYPVYRTGSRADNQGTWYYSFEADGNLEGGFNSDRAWHGSKEITQTIPSDVPYTIDWMERGSDGRWTYQSDAFTGRMFFLDKVIDNVRIYPSAATATNWTWTPAGELSSVTDGIGMTTSYEYDDMGRLTTVFDTDKKKITSYEYRYDSPITSYTDNYVKKRQYTDESGSSSTETINYYDGLGRPWKTFSLKAGRDNDGKPSMNLCVRTDYDASGRAYRTWLPFRTSSVAPQTEASSSEYLRIYSDNEPFSYVEYDGSPLDRPRAEYGPGEKWHSNRKAVRYEYKTNKSEGLLKVTNYRIGTAQDTTVTVVRSGKHTFGTLSVKSVTDEDGLTLLTFTDLYGRTVLERRHPASGEDLDTYYVYDAMGRLAAVMPPVLSKKAESSSTTKIDSAEIDKYAYLYTYDANGNCTAKKLPGCGWTRYIYDKANRPVFSQDAENRRMGRWTFSFSDIHGRNCVIGYCEGDMATLKQAVSASNVVATRQGTAGGPYMGYSVSGLSLTNPVVLSASYYDDYSFIDSQVPSDKRSLMNYSEEEYGLTTWDNVHGLQTGSAERILSEGNWNDFRWSTCYYDKKGNVIQTRTTRKKSGVDVTTTDVTFTGKPKRAHISHDYGQSGELNEYYKYTYDNWERLLTVTHRMGESTDSTVLSDIKYDGIGRVKSDGKTSFTYNVRSWTKSITGPGLSEVMSYENGGQWGGNISGINWSAGTGAKVFQDTYGYDGLSRLSSSTRCMKSDPTHRYINDYTYDEHSNIVRSLYKEENISSLTGGIINSTLKVFNHDGNRLESGITTTGTNSQQAAYSYDRNGRLTLSEDQGMTEIRYNAVGYPSYIKIAGNGHVDNTYTSGGTRLESRRTDVNGEVTAMAYEGNEVFENGKRRMLLFDGGYVDFSGNEPRYCWYTKDHLGSVRAVADAEGNVFSTYAYGPYGEDFAAESLTESNQGGGSHDFGQITTYQGEIPEAIQDMNITAYPGVESPYIPPTSGNSGRIDVGEASNIPYSAAASPNWQPYKFSGKESLTRVGLDLYDFGARMYSPSNMRWTTMDPLAEKYYHISPYSYCSGNPINRIDPNGKEDYKLHRDGTLSATGKGVFDPYDRIISDKGESIVVRDKKVIEEMRACPISYYVGQDVIEQGTMHYTVTSMDRMDKKDLLEVFKFLADNSDVEWDLLFFKEGYVVLATDHLSSVFYNKSLFYYLEHQKPEVSKSTLSSKVHNHTPQEGSEESSTGHDQTNAKNCPDIYSYVYFSASGNTYLVTANGVTLIGTLGNIGL